MNTNTTGKCIGLGGLEFKGDLVLEGAPITSLPEGLTVGGDLYLGRTQITSLHTYLKVRLGS